MAANSGAVIFAFFTVYLACKIAELIREKISEFKISKKNHEPEYSDIDYAEALNNKFFGDFKLSEAAAIFKDSKIIPKEGFVIEKFTAENGKPMNRITVSVSEERLYSLFDDLVCLLGETVAVVLEQFSADNNDHVDYYAYQKETVIVRSMLTNYENALVKDGFLKISIYENINLNEVKITDHKTIDIFTFDTTVFKDILAIHGFKEEMCLPFFYEQVHFHLVSSGHHEVVESLKNDLLIEQAIYRPLDSEGSCV